MLVKSSYKPLLCLLGAIIALIIGLTLLSDSITIGVYIFFPIFLVSYLLVVIFLPLKLLQHKTLGKVIPALLLVISVLAAIAMVFIGSILSGSFAGGTVIGLNVLWDYTPLVIIAVGVWQFIYLVKKK